MKKNSKKTHDHKMERSATEIGKALRTKWGIGKPLGKSGKYSDN